MNLGHSYQSFHTEDTGFVLAFADAKAWPNGPVCDLCGDRADPHQGDETSRPKLRRKCAACFRVVS